MNKSQANKQASAAQALPPLNDVDQKLRDDLAGIAIEKYTKQLEAGRKVAEKSLTQLGPVRDEATLFLSALDAAEAVLIKTWQAHNGAAAARSTGWTASRSR